MKEIITVRDLAMVTSDIQGAQKRGAIQLVSSLIEIGGLLIEAKTMVEPKNWEAYIWDNFGYSTSSADNWMKLYREYGDDQAAFFNRLQDSQTFGRLSYTKLLALADIPAEERLEFAEQNDVENMSTRQLQQAIKERDEARKALADSEEKLSDAYIAIKEVKQEKAQATSTLESENKALRDKAEKAKKAQSVAEADLKKLQKKLSDAEKAAKKAAEDAKKAAENPEVPESVMEQMRAEIAAEEAEKAAANIQKALDEAQKRANLATTLAEEAESRLAEAERKLAAQRKESTMANPDVAVFKSQLQQIQADFTRLKDTVEKIRCADANTADQLMNVTRQLLDKLRQEVA